MTPQAGSWTQVDVAGAIATHAADLDAHTLEPFEKIRVGAYLANCGVGLSTDKTITQYVIEAMLLIVTRDITIDRIALEVETLDAGKTARLGIYNCDSDLYPSDLVKDCGTVSLAATGIQAKTLTPSISLSKGRYFLAVIGDSDGVAEIVGHFSSGGPGLGHSTYFDSVDVGYTYAGDAGDFAALPDPFPAGQTPIINRPTLAVRIESFD